jgi:flagellar assembly factor FliW
VYLETEIQTGRRSHGLLDRETSRTSQFDSWADPVLTMSSPKSAFASLLERVKPENAVHFENGLPGFPGETQFVVLQNPEDRPFAWMQSLKTPSLVFVVTGPFSLFPDYRPDVSDNDLAALGSPKEDEILLLSILKVLPVEPPEIHTNLKAPIVINLRTLRARQVILLNESMYSEKAVYRVKH